MYNAKRYQMVMMFCIVASGKATRDWILQYADVV